MHKVKYTVEITTNYGKTVTNTLTISKTTSFNVYGFLTLTYIHMQDMNISLMELKALR